MRQQKILSKRFYVLKSDSKVLYSHVVESGKVRLMTVYPNEFIHVDDFDFSTVTQIKRHKYNTLMNKYFNSLPCEQLTWTYEGVEYTVGEPIKYKSNSCSVENYNIGYKPKKSNGKPYVPFHDVPCSYGGGIFLGFFKGKVYFVQSYVNGGYMLHDTKNKNEKNTLNTLTWCSTLQNVRPIRVKASGIYV